MAVAKPLHLRLFIEGQETPVVSANIQANLNGPAAASIQIVPVDQGMDFAPRSMVHLFYLDARAEKYQESVTKKLHIERSVSSSAFLNDTVDGGPEEITQTDTVDKFSLNSKYRLIFAGETIGFSFVKTPQSRALILQCLDFSSYWDSAHATALIYGPGGNAFTETSYVQASDTKQFDDIVNQQQEWLTRWLRGKPSTPGLQQIDGLAGGLIRMMEDLGGIIGHTKGVNDFFTVAELRCRLLAQLTAEEHDNTARRLLSSQVFHEWLQNGLENIGLQVTFRDMLKLLSQYIFYDTVPNPAPKYDPGTKGSTTVEATSSVTLNQHPTIKRAISEIQTNVLIGLDKARKEDTATSRINVAESTIQSMKKVASILRTLNGGVSDQIRAMEEAATSLSGKFTALGAGSADLSDERSKVNDVLKELETNTSRKVSSVGRTITTATTARLRTQILRPDCFFAAPPRCNVIFPEQYSQFSYDRAFVNETTRVHLRLYNTLIGKDGLLADTVLAPSLNRDAVSVTGRRSYRNLMRHELHTGILPREEWIPNTIMVKPDTTEDQEQKNRDSRTYYARQVALFHFFKFRFAARTLNGAGPFNPNLVVGFPGALITRPLVLQGDVVRPSSNGLSIAKPGEVDEETLDIIGSLSDDPNPDIARLVPYQLVGMIGGLSHNIDQNGGITTFAMHHVRRHFGTDDEFVGVFSGTRSVVGRVKTALNLDELRRSENTTLLQKLVEATPQDPKTGTKTKVVRSASKKRDGTVTAFLSEERGKTIEYADYVTTGRLEGVEYPVLVPGKETKLASSKKGIYDGKLVGIEVKDADIEVMDDGSWAFRSVIIHEDVTLTEKKRATPIENILRPNWISGVYDNANIGKKIYDPFFGCGAITDEFASALDGQSFGSSGDIEIEATAGDSLTSVQTTISDIADNRALASIEKALNVLSYTYGLAKTREGADVDEFIQSYTYRPIATLEDVLGSDDLELEVADVAGDSADVTVRANRVKVLQGKVGFHSMAVHPAVVNKKELAGLLEDPEIGLSRLDKASDPEPVPFAYDVRKEKLDRVLEYLGALGGNRAFRG